MYTNVCHCDIIRYFSLSLCTTTSALWLIMPLLIDTTLDWQIMEVAHDDKLTRAIGVSNFNSRQIRRLLNDCRIAPAVNQVSCVKENSFPCITIHYTVTSAELHALECAPSHWIQAYLYIHPLVKYASHTDTGTSPLNVHPLYKHTHPPHQPSIKCSPPI